MLILAFDTSGSSGSVAVLEGERVLSHMLLTDERRSAQTLAPAIVETLRLAGVEAKQIRLVATTVGPGSFTGLRVGVTTAKTMAYALKAQVLGVGTLETIAQQALAMDGSDTELPAHLSEIQAILNAERKELFVGRFAIERQQNSLSLQDVLRRKEPPRLVAGEAWLAGLTSNVLISGAGLTRWLDRLPANIDVASETLWRPSAITVGKLAWRDYQQGRRDDLWKLSPVYGRPSYAEEKASRAPHDV